MIKRLKEDIVGGLSLIFFYDCLFTNVLMASDYHIRYLDTNRLVVGKSMNMPDDLKKRENAVRVVASMIMQLSVGFMPKDFLTALALVAAAIVHERYKPSERQSQVRKFAADMKKFILQQGQKLK